MTTERSRNDCALQRIALGSRKYLLAFVVSVSLLTAAPSVFIATAQDADRTFSHPAEDNQTKNLTLAPGTYTFQTDADPNGYHRVDWYNTYSGGTRVGYAYLYYYDNIDFNIVGSGWIRAEIYKSDIFNGDGAWEASYRWNVTVQLPSYTVSAYAGTGGTVTPSSRTVTQGNTTTFTVSPSTGYSRGSVSGDAAGGSWSGNTYTTASVTQNRSLTFSFVLNTYTVTATAGTGGTVSPSSRSVTHGNTTTFTVSPSTGYSRGSVSGDAAGGSWSGNTYTTAPVTQDRSLTFSFVLNTYTVTAAAGTGGTVSPSSRSATHGNTTTFTVSPATGYTRGSVSGDASGGSWSGNTYTTAPVTQNRSLTFSFLPHPDLVISSLTRSQTSGYPGQSVTIDSITKNNGTADTGLSTWCKVRYFLGRTSGELWREIGWGWTPNLLELNGISIGEEEPDTISWTIDADLSPARYYITAVADADGAIDEGTNEGNNSTTVIFDVTAVIYTVSATAATGGTVSPSSRSVAQGNTTTFTVSPLAGFTRGSVSGDASGGSWSGNTYTTAPVTQNRSLTFSFLPHPDLVISSLTRSQTSGYPGQSVTIDSITKNNGTADTGLSTWCKVRYFLGRTSGELWREIGWGWTPNLLELNGISIGEEEPDTISWTIDADLSPARYYITAVADADGAIDEGTNEGNNSTTVTFDVVLQTYTVSATTGTGGSVSPSSRSVSHGNATTFTVSPSAGYTRGGVSGDAAGGSWSANTYTTAPVTQNRSLSFAFVAHPDLVISSLTRSQTSGYPGQSVTITSNTRNNGPADTGLSTWCKVRYYLGRTSGELWREIGWGWTPNLQELNGISVGEDEPDSISWTIDADLSPARYYITAVADADGNFDEASNEGNNATTVTFDVVAVPRILSAYWWMPLDVSHGDDVTMCAEVSGIPVGTQCTFQVFEDDGILLPDDPVLPTITGTVYSAEGGKTYVKATWSAQWVNDQSGDPEYYFKVTYGDVPLKSSRSADEEVMVRNNRQQPSTQHGDFYFDPGPAVGEATKNATLTDDRIPVILVHGMSGDKKTDSLNYWYGWANADTAAAGAQLGRFNEADMKYKFRVYRYVYDSRRPIGDNGADFAAFVNQFYQSNPAFSERQVVILAHSMGGLVARYALNTDSTFRDKVHRLVTLGTPHLGSPGANPTWIYWDNVLNGGNDNLLKRYESVIHKFVFEGNEVRPRVVQC